MLEGLLPLVIPEGEIITLERVNIISWRDRAGLFQGLVGDQREQRFLGQGLSPPGGESPLMAGVVKAKRIVRKMTMGIVLVHTFLVESPKLKVGRFGPAFALNGYQTQFNNLPR